MVALAVCALAGGCRPRAPVTAAPERVAILDGEAEPLRAAFARDAAAARVLVLASPT
jgi:hypothetical protein